MWPPVSVQRQGTLELKLPKIMFLSFVQTLDHWILFRQIFLNRLIRLSMSSELGILSLTLFLFFITLSIFWVNFLNLMVSIVLKAFLNRLSVFFAKSGHIIRVSSLSLFLGWLFALSIWVDWIWTYNSSYIST